MSNGVLFVVGAEMTSRRIAQRALEQIELGQGEIPRRSTQPGGPRSQLLLLLPVLSPLSTAVTMAPRAARLARHSLSHPDGIRLAVPKGSVPGPRESPPRQVPGPRESWARVRQSQASRGSPRNHASISGGTCELDRTRGADVGYAPCHSQTVLRKCSIAPRCP